MISFIYYKKLGKKLMIHIKENDNKNINFIFCLIRDVSHGLNTLLFYSFT